MVDISGKIPGDAEVLKIVNFILAKFEAVAQDDYTDHCWNLDEIRSGEKKDNHPFFDYDGWYEDRRG